MVLTDPGASPFIRILPQSRHHYTVCGKSNRLYMRHQDLPRLMWRTTLYIYSSKSSFTNHQPLTWDNSETGLPSSVDTVTTHQKWYYSIPWLRAPSSIEKHELTIGSEKKSCLLRVFGKLGTMPDCNKYLFLQWS